MELFIFVVSRTEHACLCNSLLLFPLRTATAPETPKASGVTVTLLAGEKKGFRIKNLRLRNLGRYPRDRLGTGTMNLVESQSVR